MKPTQPTWPKNADGSPKKMGEMTAAEKKAQIEYAVSRLKAEIESPEFEKAFDSVFRETVVDCRNCGGDGFSIEGGDCPACKGTGKNNLQRKL